jgi:hypothetical protein
LRRNVTRRAVTRRVLARPGRLGTPVVLCVAVVALATLAVRSPGFPVQHLSLNDGGIWVTDQAAGAIGRFDKPIAQLDGAIAPVNIAPDIDVWQNGTEVVSYSQGKLYSVDVTKPAFTDSGTPVSPATSHGATQIALNASTLALIGTDNALRATALTQNGASVAAVASGATPLDTKLSPGSAVAVDADNDIFVAGGGALRTYPSNATSGTGWDKPTTTSLPFPVGDPLEVTAIGDIPVVADPATNVIYLPQTGQRVPLPSQGTGLVLQQSSAGSTFAAATTTQALYRIDLASGRRTTITPGESGQVAAPVQLDGCVHAAWANGETGSYVRSCGGAHATPVQFSDGDSTPDLVFRVNNGEIVLNDAANGDVFLVDSNTIVPIQPRWQELTRRPRNPKPSNTALPNPQNAPLIAKPVTQGVRPGRTTVVHVLDDASGPAGAILAVTQVGQPDNPAVAVTVAPDGQSVLATVADGLTTDAHFSYTIDDGHGSTRSAQVTLVPHGPNVNGPPRLRDNYAPPSLAVAAGGHLVIPVAGDWRDPDGDPLYVDDNSDPSAPDLFPSAPNGTSGSPAGTVGVTSSGALSFTAPQATTSQTVTIHYSVSDGMAKPVPVKLTVNVLGSGTMRPVSPTAEPVVAQATVGMPVTIHPLASDIPGVDPTNPQAQLTLASAKLDAPVTGGTVSTDLTSGTVTFTARQPGAFFLSYQAAFGATAPSTNTIRVQATAATGQPKPPVVLPAVAVLHGQQPATVDVLAGDYDPQGWVLGVISAASSDPGIHVAVVDQQWLRITSDDPVPGHTAAATYQVSDGFGVTTGSVSITAEAASSSDEITTQDASITIRSGDSAAVPVLASDSSSAGLPLQLAATSPTMSPLLSGLIAANQGADVRVDAPAGVTQTEETTVTYVATDSAGTTAAGLLYVTIEPPPGRLHPDQPPAPQDITVRETAGDVALIQIPTYGTDPDGDSTTVTAVTVAPAFGRIVAIGPDTISYQSYPGSSGTDTFTYEVTDPYGESGTATVSVGIMPPGVPQSPVAVDDAISAPPGATVHVNVLANDIIAPGDPVSVVPLSQTNKTPPSGAQLDGDFIYLTAPASVSDPPAELTYGVTDGTTAPSLARFIVRAVAGAKIPPVANDAIASPPAPGAASVTVNVLKNDDDPVGSASDLKIIWAPPGVSVKGPDLVIPVKPQPRQVPYEIEAPDGLTATAVVFVPGTATSAIRLKPGARITVTPNGSVSVPLSSVLVDSYGRSLRLTANQLSASPSGNLTVTAASATEITVRAEGAYQGPGAVTVQVYDGATIQDPTGHVATLTIPAQVGRDVPILRCPTGPGNVISLVEGGAAVTYNIGLLCHVWTDTTVNTAPPRYTVSWAMPLNGVTATVTGGGTSLQLQAGTAAGHGTGVLKITPVGGTTATAANMLTITVIPAPPPSGTAISLATKAGQPVTVDLSQYVTSPLPRSAITVLRVPQPAGGTASFSGSKVTITPASTFHGTLNLIAVVTDVPRDTSREINVAITVSVISKPGAPGIPSASASNQTLVVSFSPAAPNGSPVQYYTVFTNGTGHQCQASPCTITGLSDGKPYNIDVTATNSAGQGPQSPSVSATPNAVPGQPAGLNVTPVDGQARLTWQAPATVGSGITKYIAEISPAPASGPEQTVTGTSATFIGLTDGTTYSLRVQAYNALGAGPWSAVVSTVPFGKPATPAAAPTATGATPPGGATTEAITVTWAADSGNGSPITGYTVTEYKDGAAQPSVPTSGGITSTTFTVPTDGSTYSYTVAATNAAGTSAPSPQSARVQAIAPPSTMAAPTVTAGAPSSAEVVVTFVAPAYNGPALTMVQYGLNNTAAAGSWSGSFKAGNSYQDTISGLTYGTSYTIYVRACAATMCGGWSSGSTPVTLYTAPAITATSLPDATWNVGYTAALSATGGNNTYTWAVTGLPTGLSLSGDTISGDPEQTGQFQLSVTVKDGESPAQTATATVTLTVRPQPPLAIETTSPLPDDTVDTPYTTTLTAAGANGVYSWSATGLPPGLNIQPDGTISGEATAAGSFTVTVTVTDEGLSSHAVFALTSRPLPPLVIETKSVPAGTVGIPYTATLVAEGGNGTYVWVSQNMPPGLSLTSNGATATISGTPTAPNDPSNYVQVEVFEAGQPTVFTPGTSNWVGLSITINP